MKSEETLNQKSSLNDKPKTTSLLNYMAMMNAVKKARERSQQNQQNQS